MRNGEQSTIEQRTHRTLHLCRRAASLDLDIENSTLMTATRNAGSLVLATCPGSLPLVPAALRQSPSACFFLCVFARARRNSSYLASYIPSINYHRRLIISGLRIFMRLREIGSCESARNACNVEGNPRGIKRPKCRMYCEW